MSRYRYRHLLLLLVAVILPSLAITALGLRIVAMEQELLGKRLEDAEKQAVGEIHAAITERLDRIKSQRTAVGADYADPAVMLVAPIIENRIVLPQDADPGAVRFKKSVNSFDFARKFDDAVRAELNGNYQGAAGLYRESVDAATNASQRTLGRFRLAGALVQSRPNAGAMDAEARGIYLDLLKLPSTDVDDQGIPFASYAAGRLVNGDNIGQDDQAVLDRVKVDIESSEAWPRGAYVLKGALDNLRSSGDSAVRQTAESASSELLKKIASEEQVLALQRAFPLPGMTSTDWQGFSCPEPCPEPWLVGMTENPPAVFAVRAATIFDSITKSSQNRDRWLQAEIVMGGSDGRQLGGNLPNLWVRFPPGRDAEMRSTYGARQMLLSLLVVVGLTFVAGYFMWRDARREIRTADLRSQFVSSVSHELKTPLTSIRMFAETLQMRDLTDPDTHARYLNTIVNESERLTRLLNNVLDVSRIERDERAYHLAPTSLEEVLDAVTRSMQYPLAQQGFTLRVQVAGGIPPVQADRDAVEQAVLNLVTNAMKYSGQSRDIELRLHAERGWALIQVMDRGTGIPVHERGRIFEKFYRAAAAQRSGIPGAGLGLALVAHIAMAHGGAVEVESEVGKGSIFTIRVPLPEGSAS